jgi:hypothetical protein
MARLAPQVKLSEAQRTTLEEPLPDVFGQIFGFWLSDKPK